MSGGAKQNVGIADRLGAHAGAHRVADHAADARVGPAVRLQGRGVIVRLDLEHHIVLVVEADDAGVVAENTHAPIVRAKVLADLLRGGKDRFAEHVLKISLARIVAIADPAGKRLVAAMLAPGLGDGFQLGVGRVAAELLEMGLDGLHFDQRQIKLSAAAQDPQGLIVHCADRHGGQAKVVGGAQCQMTESQGANDHLLDGVVGQDFCISVSTRSEASPSIQYFFSVRTTSAFSPKSPIADITLWATGSITPGLGSTWIRRTGEGEKGRGGDGERGGQGNAEFSLSAFLPTFSGG